MQAVPEQNNGQFGASKEVCVSVCVCVFLNLSRHRERRGLIHVIKQRGSDSSARMKGLVSQKV